MAQNLLRVRRQHTRNCAKSGPTTPAFHKMVLTLTSGQLHAHHTFPVSLNYACCSFLVYIHVSLSGGTECKMMCSRSWEVFLTSASILLHGSLFFMAECMQYFNWGFYARSCVNCRFAHLVNYGGSYYSYAYAMCLASSVWEKLFQADPLNRKAGEQHLIGGWWF